MFVMATRSRVNRGVITAVNWLRRPMYRSVTTATFTEAVATVEDAG